MRKERDMKLIDILCKFAVLAGATMISIPFLSNDILLPQILRVDLFYAILGKKDLTINGAVDSSEELNIRSGINSDDDSNLKIGVLSLVNAGSVHYQVRTSFGWNELRPAEMAIHSRKKMVGVTFVEDDGMVNTFTISKMYSEDYLNESWNLSNAGSTAAGPITTKNGGNEQPQRRESDSMTNDSEDSMETENERILTIPTSTHSVRIVTDSVSQTLQIRQHIMGKKGDGAGGSSIRSDAASEEGSRK
ncbi:UNVERIFIED_CONTAM: hypothetical protein HDU68_000707 [Siphonaria sp. JEL0065]|nr:hypothetical protein HDU68_000707 [Siphonaria sp. JEL0065]